MTLAPGADVINQYNNAGITQSDWSKIVFWLSTANQKALICAKFCWWHRLLIILNLILSLRESDRRRVVRRLKQPRNLLLTLTTASRFDVFVTLTSAAATPIGRHVFWRLKLDEYCQCDKIWFNFLSSLWQSFFKSISLNVWWRHLGLFKNTT